MESTEQNLKLLLINLLSIDRKIKSVYIYDKEGLIIASASAFHEKEDQEEILGAISSSFDQIISRVRNEFKLGNWSTGSIETETHRLIFLEAGKDSMLLLVTDFNLSINEILPYAFLVAEKIIRISNHDYYPGFSINIPNLHWNPMKESVLESLKNKKVSLIDDNEESVLSLYSLDTFSMNYKTIVMGDASVGKTSLIQKFTTGKFRNDYMPTLGISITEQKYKMIGDVNSTVNFMIWDLAGQKFFKRARTVYIQGAQAAFLVYDCTNKESFNNIPEWNKEISSDSNRMPVVLIANKIDLKDQRVITPEEGKRLALQLKCSYIETSALTGENVHEAFQLLGIGLFFQTTQQIDNQIKI